MKCSNPHCTRSLGLIYQRGWFSNRRYCSRNCRDAFMANLPRRSRPELSASTYLEWLFLAPPPQKSTPAIVRIKARQG